MDSTTPMTAPTDVTALLQRLSSGDRSAEAELLPHIYAELKRLAAAYLRNERPGHTLQATALVHEAYLKLTTRDRVQWQGRAHFFAIAAMLMRRILTDYGRQHRAGKRGGGGANVPLDDNLQVSTEQCVMIADLSEALDRLTATNPRQARVVELRFFSGLSEEEIAQILDVSPRTVKRDWAVARAWLFGQLNS